MPWSLGHREGHPGGQKCPVFSSAIRLENVPLSVLSSPLLPSLKVPEHRGEIVLQVSSEISGPHAP